MDRSGGRGARIARPDTAGCLAFNGRLLATVQLRLKRMLAFVEGFSKDGNFVDFTLPKGIQELRIKEVENIKIRE